MVGRGERVVSGLEGYQATTGGLLEGSDMQRKTPENEEHEPAAGASVKGGRRARTPAA